MPGITVGAVVVAVLAAALFLLAWQHIWRRRADPEPENGFGKVTP